MHPPGNGAGTAPLGSSLATIAVGITMLAGCSVLIPSTTGRPTTTLPVGRGAVRHFPLAAGSDTLPLPASRNLVLMLQASESLSAPVSFRVTATGALGGDARFTQAGLGGDRDAEAGGLLAPGPGAARRVQGGRKVQAEQPIGAILEFWINRGDNLTTGDCHRLGTVKWRTPRAYFVVDTGPADAQGCDNPVDPNDLPTDDQLRDMAAAFEGDAAFPGAQGIFSTVTNLFGPAPDAGIDGDPRTFVMLSPAVDNFGKDKGLLGYFWNRDVQPGQTHSNKKEVIFLTSTIFNQRRYTTYGTLAHEFTHLVMYHQRTTRGAAPADVWWDEALSMLSMDQTGYGLKAGNEDIAKDVQSFLQQPGANSLTNWEYDPHQFAYGLVYLFARYVHDRFSQDFIRESLGVRENGGVAGLDKLLRKRGTTFQQVYEDFMVAVYTSGTLLDVDSRYKMAQDVNLRTSFGNVVLEGIHALHIPSFGQQENISLRPWGTAFYEFGQEEPKAWTFSFRVPGMMFGSAIGW